MKDFMERMTGKDVNKRVIENFIKAGALDGLGGTRQSAYDGLRCHSWISVAQEPEEHA